MNPRKPIARYKRPNRKRPGAPRRGQLTAAQKLVIRRQVYERDGGRCQLNLGPKCNRAVMPFDGDLFKRAHLCHIKSAGSGGAFTPENLRIGCVWCHIGYEHTEGRKAA